MHQEISSVYRVTVFSLLTHSCAFPIFTIKIALERGPVGAADPGVSSVSQNRQWRWADGTSFSYKTWSGKPVRVSEHCAEMSSKGGEFEGSALTSARFLSGTKTDTRPHPPFPISTLLF